MKVALDAGHGACRGPAFTGAAANGLVEDELALDFVRRIGHHLRASGHRTVYTRPDESLVPLGERGKIATESGCDVFLSIHCNAGLQVASGVEAFAVEGDNRSRELAVRLVNTVAARGLRNRGAKWDGQSQYSRLRVLRDTYRHMPAVILEIGFLTSPHDSKLLTDRFFREAVAVAVAEVVASPVL